VQEADQHLAPFRRGFFFEAMGRTYFGMNLKAGGTTSSLAALIAPLRRGFFLSEQTVPIIVGCVAFALWPSDERRMHSRVCDWAKSAGSQVREERDLNG
jgi:hypothetical protein